MTDVKNVPLVDRGRTHVGRMVKLRARSAVDFHVAIDRLNGYVVPAVLIVFIVISANFFKSTGDESIRCLEIAELSKFDSTYALGSCQTAFKYLAWPDGAKEQPAYNKESRVFPMRTLCDVAILRIGGYQHFTLQCHMRINATNEKIYLFIWWCLPVVALFTAISFLYYLLTFLMPWSCERLTRDLLKDTRHSALVNSEDEKNCRLIRMFAERGMRRDGLLLFGFIEARAGASLARELCDHIFEEYRNQVAADPENSSLTDSDAEQGLTMGSMEV